MKAKLVEVGVLPSAAIQVTLDGFYSTSADPAGPHASHQKLISNHREPNPNNLAARQEPPLQDLKEAYQDWLYQWAERRLREKLPAHFSAAEFFSPIPRRSWPEWYDRRGNAGVMKRLEKDGHIRPVGLGKSIRLNGNPGIATLYEVI